MKQKKGVALHLEALEDRWVPATVRLISGSLFVSNPLITAGSSSLTLTQKAANSWQVVDGSATLGTYSGVGNLFIFGGNAKTTETVNLNTFTYGGNLFVNNGNGNDTVALSNGAGGNLLGNVTVLNGFGNDSVGINSATANAMTIGGNVLVTDRSGNDSFTFGNGGGVTTLGGNLTLSGIANIQLDQGKNDVVGGTVNVSPGTNLGGHLSLEQGLISGSEVLTVGGNFNIASGPLSADVFLRGMNLGGNLNLQLGNGVGPDPAFGQPGNFFGLSSSPSTVTVINGDLNYTSGSGADTLDLGSGVVNGNMGINVGNGNVNISLETFTAQTIIGGNLTINAGNGNDLIGPLAGDGGNQAKIGGNADFNLGSGRDTVSFDAGGSLGGTLNMHSGNGNDSLTLAAAQVYNVNVTFGNADDTFTLNNASAVVTGSVNGGGRINGNVFNQVAGTLGSPFTLSNFP
jgi:hypothetical protein